MKHALILAAAVLALYGRATAQYRFEAIHENQQVQLNSGGRAMFGGVSRSYLPVGIPDGAIGVAYTVRSSMGYDASNDLKLASQLALAATGHLALAMALDQVDIPPSNAVVDVFVIPQDGGDLSMFLEKKDGKWRQYTDYACLSSLGCRRFVKASSGMQGKVYLCLRNPSLTSRIIVTVDAVAVFEE